MRAIGWHHRHADVLEHQQLAGQEKQGVFPCADSGFLCPPQQLPPAINKKALAEAYARRKCTGVCGGRK